MSELTPVTRIEEYLDAIVDGGTPPLEDVTRVETFLDCIYNNTVCPLTPVTRIEMFLGKISGQDIELPEPVTRVEQYLAAIAGEDVEIPDEPVTRIEEWLAEWANGGSPEYATVTGAIASFVTLRAAPLKELVVDIEPVQSGSGDPSPDNVRPISGWTGATVTRTNGNLWSKAYGRDNPVNLKSGTKLYIKCTLVGLGLYGRKPDSSALLIKQIGSASTTYSVTLASDITALVVSETTYNNLINSGGDLMVSLEDISTIETGVRDAYNISWQTEAGTVYGGTLTVNEDGSGSVKARPYYASYNGETLVEPWISSMDKYVSGTTPTTGAQVVDLGGTETSTNLTPGQVTALLGQNYVWADTGDVSVTYYYPGTTASPIVGVGTVNNMVI